MIIVEKIVVLVFHNVYLKPYSLNINQILIISMYYINELFSQYYISEIIITCIYIYYLSLFLIVVIIQNNVINLNSSFNEGAYNWAIACVAHVANCFLSVTP